MNAPNKSLPVTPSNQSLLSQQLEIENAIVALEARAKRGELSPDVVAKAAKEARRLLAAGDFPSAVEQLVAAGWSRQ